MVGIHGLAGSGKSYLVENMVSQAAGFSVVRVPVTTGIEGPAADWRYAFQLSGDLVMPTGIEGDDDTDPLRASFMGTLRATARYTSSPVLVIYEDVTRSNLEVAETLASAVLDPELGIPAVLVLTSDDFVQGSTLSFTQTSFPVHKLQSLTLDQSSEYLLGRIGKLPDPSVLAELWRATGGNPAALLSACSHLRDEELDGLVPLPDPVPIGSELAEAFGSWADALNGEAAPR